MRKSDLLERPEIVALKPEFEAKGIPFDSALDVALDKANGLTYIEKEIIKIVVRELNAMLQAKPATTRVGRWIRFILSIFSK